MMPHRAFSDLSLAQLLMWRLIVIIDKLVGDGDESTGDT